MVATRFAWLSIAAAVLTIALKAAAYLVTSSVGLLSDALESIVNLVAAIVALIALTVASKPPDEGHTYGHGKAEYFSSATEGLLILVAAVGIIVTAVRRLIEPLPLERLGIGIVISTIASLVNLGVALVLLRAGRRERSITLEADAHHLMTDVVTTGGVIAGVGAVALTGWTFLDPLLAIAVALWIVRNGVLIVKRSISGLLDASISKRDLARVEAILDSYRERNVHWHALRTRQGGARIFVTVHVLVPGEWSVRRGHELLEEIEARIRGALGNTHVLTHLEPVEDEVSYRDQELDRETAVSEPRQ